jgi:hypothetical protein
MARRIRFLVNNSGSGIISCALPKHVSDDGIYISSLTGIHKRSIWPCTI